MRNKILFPVLIVLWVLSLIFTANYVQENFDKILIFKNALKKKSYVNANAYKVNIERENFKPIQVTDLKNLSAEKVFERLNKFLSN